MKSIDHLTDSELSKIHGIANIWKGMIHRCYSVGKPSYENYGGRGISVCDRWRENFQNFCRDMWPRPDGTSLDRINNDGNYEPSNCRWATFDEQIRNRRTSQYIMLLGERRYLSDVAEEYGLNASTLRNRICIMGMTPKQAVGLERWINPLAKPVLFNGEMVQIQELARKFGLTEICIKKRIQSGMTPEESVAKKVEQRGGDVSKRLITVDGEEGTILHFATKHNVPVTQVYARIDKLGWTLKQALGIEPKPPRTSWNASKKPHMKKQNTTGRV